MTQVNWFSLLLLTPLKAALTEDLAGFLGKKVCVDPTIFLKTASYSYQLIFKRRLVMSSYTVRGPH